VGVGRLELEARVRVVARSAAPRRFRLRLSVVGGEVVEEVGLSSVGVMEGSLVENRSWMSAMEGGGFLERLSIVLDFWD